MRFSGFDDEWKTYKLKDLLHNKSSSISINQLDDNVGNYPLYGASGFLKCIDFYEMDSDYISIVKDGSGVGNISFHEKNTSVVNTSQYILPKENLNIHFIFYLLQTINLNKYKTGSTIPHIYFKDYSIEKVKIPKYDEQKKIGILLKNLDAKIEILDNKLQMCQNFKKYLMQQIFTQKLRFDFNDEWRIRRLNEITFYQEGPGVRNYQYTKEGVKLLNVGNFVNNALELDNTDKYISNEEAYGKYKHFLVDEGDLLIACSGIKAEYFDEKIAFAENKHLPLCMNTSTMRFKSLDENTLNLRYLKYYFQTQSFKKQVFQVMTGSAQFNFGPTHLKYFKIPIPCLDEQIKIYQMFESIDIKILNIYREIMKVKEFKKGLLQQMFVVQLILSLLQNKKHI